MGSVSVGKLIHTLNVSNSLGEGVIWDCESQCIWWTDIQASMLFQFSVESNSLNQYAMPMRVGCFALIENDPRLIVAFEKGIALYHLQSQALQWLATPEIDKSHHRFNDGRVDRQGRFWAGTMVESPVENRGEDPQGINSVELGALYCIDHQLSCHKILSGIEIANSLCWSPEGDYVYHADSVKQQIQRFEFNQTPLSFKRPETLAYTANGALPDGADVDSDGYIWSAHWNGGKVVRYDPEGHIDLELLLPVSNPTSVTIGGKDLNWLIITSAKEGLSEQQLADQPMAGSLFIYELHGVKGLGSNRFLLGEAVR
ncbi:SMP-30/gluconolactonase/LRE family protein [Shewanella sp. AS1]|uniref:SMP-30/gluconolactonase/LRE family protein n=1 Tax=Shewanella sp. AS1 TaxID=2907626 RepID=UPI001F3FEBED|nr:SMP-30/gluconolactonase/LRE family protein [Shewanella sp. AS1]MCE9678502.1 SMP-30/gluconolactonase/LRE family protein [Shewanella sp. AS1]